MSKVTRIIDIKVVGTQELQELEKAILSNEQKLKNMSAASKKNAGMQKIHAKNIVDTKLKLKQLRGERNLEQKSILQSQQATVKLDGSYNSLVARNKQLLIAMKRSTGGINSNSAEMQKMKAEYTANNGKLKEFDKSLGNNFRNVGNYSGALQGAKEKLAAVGLAVGGAVIAFQAISRVVQQVTGDFGEFEKGFTNVLSLLSKADIAQFGDKLKTGAIDVMREFGLEIGDMNKALFDAVSAGVPAANAIDFLRVASELAIGGVTDLTTATDGITTVINAFGLEASEATEVASAFFSAQKFGKTTVEELSQTIGTVAPIAKQAGLGYKELLSAMAVLTKQGLNTNIATTALRASITALANPSDTAKKEFKELGINFGLSALRGEGFIEVLGQISKAAENDIDSISKLIPNVRALTGIGALGTEQLEDYSNILQQVNTDYGDNSSLAAAVLLQRETLEQSQARLNAEFSAQKILLGEELKPVFQAVINALTFMIEKANAIGITLKAGALAWGVYSVAIALSNVRLATFSVASTLADAKARVLNSTLLKNPYVLAATALAALVGGLYAYIKASEGTLSMRERLKKVDDEATENYSVQLNQIDEYVKIAKNESNSTDQRQKAIDKLNQEVKEFNGTLSLQNIESTQTAVALDKYKNAIINTAKATAAKAEIERMVVEQQALRKIVNDVTKAFLEFDSTGNPTAQSLKKVRDMTSDNNATIKELNVQMDALAKKTAALTLGNGDFTSSITLADIAEKEYANSVVGLQQKIADITTARNNATRGSDEFTRATNQLKQAQLELNAAQDTGGIKAKTLEQINSLSETTLNEIAIKKAELNKLLKEEVLNSEDFVKVKNEIIRLDTLKATGDISTKANKEDLIAKLKEEIKAQEDLLLVLGQSGTVSKERNAANVTLLQKEIDLIFAKQTAGKEINDADLKQIAHFKNEIEKLGGAVGEDGEDNVMVKLFGGGEAGAEAFANTMTSLSSINGLIGARADLQNKETQERIKGINTVEATELKALRDSARFKRMTDEQKAAAEKKITDKAAAEREVFEREAFERNKKSSKQQAIISGAQAVMKIAAQYAYPFSLIPIAAQILMTRMQLQTIDKSTFALGGMIEKYAKGGELAGGGIFTGASHKNGGIKFQTGGRLMEAEGGEAIINKESTAMFRSELSAINQAGGGVKFADGGLTRGLDGVIQSQLQSSMSDEDVGRIAQALSTQEVVVTEQSISSTQRQVNVLEQRMSF